MKFTYSWLRTHVTCALSAQELSKILTMSGLEVEAMSDLAAGLTGVVVGRIETIQPHPAADRLTVCRVAIHDEYRTIVCGARNHRPQDKVAVALPGTTLPNGLTITESSIRGQHSAGMLCSLTELGMEEKSDGILILPATTPEGQPIAEYFSRQDWFFEVAITPNRGDCLSVRGIAREIAALTGQSLHPITPQVTVTPEINQISPVTVVIDDKEGAPRYVGRVIRNITIQESPQWLKNRLLSVGLRPINAVVDITNWVMLDLGQPMHAFDLDQITAPIVVRRAVDGESLQTLDGSQRLLTRDMTVIADQQNVLALAGIMGGEKSGTGPKTQHIFLEAAYFNPIRVARTGRQLGLLSESRHRFERGCDPEILSLAVEQASHYILALCGGQAGDIITVDAATWQPKPPILFSPERANQLGGINLAAKDMARLLASIGCQTQDGQQYQPPSFRHDLACEEDLVEEIVRLYGYDRVETKMPLLAATPSPRDLLLEGLELLRRVAVGMGYWEAVNYAFVHPRWQQRVDPQQKAMALLNPISEEQGVLRTTLMAGLLEAARRNVSRGHDRLRMFELGRVFLPHGNSMVEEERFACIMLGTAHERSWNHERRMVDFFDLKGDVEQILRSFAIANAQFVASQETFLHPGQSARIYLPSAEGKEGQWIGWMGALHPVLCEEMELTTPAWLFECRCQPLIEAQKQLAVAGISKYPAVDRDFAFVVDEAVAAGAMLETIRQVAPQRIEKTAIVDIYTGEAMGRHKKSVALNVRLRAQDRTLTEAESRQISDAIITAMQNKFAARLRSG